MHVESYPSTFETRVHLHTESSAHKYEVCGVKQLREAGQVRLTVCQIQRIVWQLLMIQYAAVPLDKCESFANELQLVKSYIELNWAHITELLLDLTNPLQSLQSL